MNFSGIFEQKETQCFLISSFGSERQEVNGKDELHNKSLQRDMIQMALLFDMLQLRTFQSWRFDKNQQGNKEKLQKELLLLFGIEHSKGCLIYFTGHGNSNGDLLLSNCTQEEYLDDIPKEEFLSLKELLVLWSQRKKNYEHLFLILDCCNANKWIRELRKQQTQNVSIITAQKYLKQVDNEKSVYASNLQKGIGSHFTTYILNTFNPNFNNNERLQTTIKGKKKDLKDDCEQLFCEHNPMKPYSYIPNPQVIKQLYNMNITKEITEWSDYDEIQKEIIQKSQDLKPKVLEEIFTTQDGQVSPRIIFKQQISEMEDQNINIFSIHFIHVRICIDPQNVNQMILFNSKENLRSKKVSFQVDDPNIEMKEENFIEIIKNVVRRDHVSIHLQFIQITDLIFSKMVDIILSQNTNLITLDLNLSFNQLTQKSLQYFFGHKDINHRLQYLENLILNFGWNDYRQYQNIQIFQTLALPNLKSLFISLSQSELTDAYVNSILNIFSNVKTLHFLHLHLEKCDIGDSTVKTIRKILIKNGLLKDFYFNAMNNNITETEIQNLSSFIQQQNCYSRFHIKLKGNQQNSELIRSINKIIQANLDKDIRNHLQSQQN